MSGISIEEVIEACDAVKSARGTRRVEVGQAQEAVATALREGAEADAATLSLDDAIAAVRSAAAALDDGEETLNTLFAAVVTAQAARGVKVVELEQAIAATNAAITETAEADVANITEDAAIEAAKEKASAYSKEE